MGGVVGFDMPAVFELARHQGHDCELLAILLPWIEAGLCAALNRKPDDT
jgi:hypothetical protein